MIEAPTYDKVTYDVASMYARIVCGDKNAKRLGLNLTRMIRPVVMAVAQHNAASDVTKEVVRSMKHNYILLSSIFAHLNEMTDFDENSPILGIYKELHPVLMASFKKFGHVAKMVEELCAIIKCIMRSIKDHFFPYLPEFARQIVEGYKTYSISTYLYCGEFTVSIFSRNENAMNILGEVFNLLGSHTFEILSKGSYTNSPEIIEDFFGMCVRYTKYTPKLVFESKILSQLLQFSIMVIGIEHYEAAKALYMFLEEFFHFFAANADKKLLQEKEMDALNFALANGPLIVSSLIRHLCAAPPKTLHQFIIDTLVEIKESLPKSSEKWMEEAIQLVMLV
eukprot:TRINITY_DN3288_c0_g5_i3.p1 TRINITY_DN3288_c0_g5~~TRINITY_DN3288_c0_g5_i3.p1  ORF type:complete len:337 (-),score=98.50 TRINITY_DN3288_c0_g5_i3:281-1291(-)